VSDDRYDRAIDEVLDATEDVREALQAWDEDLLEARRQRGLGNPVVAIVDNGIGQGSRDRRVAVDEAIAGYRSAVMRLRAAAVLALVDGEGMTLTAAAKQLRISRQMASRLYATAQPGVRRPDQARLL
jgi:anti-sigma-K factor RskA